MANLSHRNDRTERMDDPDFPPVDYDRCLADLERVNRLTLTHRPTLTCSAPWLPGPPAAASTPVSKAST